MSDIEKPDLHQRRAQLIEQNEKRNSQVQQWQQQINDVQRAIAATKEAHDYTRGQIDVLNEILDKDEADSPIAEETSDDSNKKPTKQKA